MGYYYTVRLFKPGRKINIGRAVHAAAAAIGAYARQSKNKHNYQLLRIGYHSGVFICEFPYCSGDFYFFKQLGLELRGVWMEARIQEGSHWEYTLYYGGDWALDNFSTLPEYWAEDELEIMARKGHPELLAKAWGVPEKTIRRYIRQWGYQVLNENTHTTILKGKAYPSDRHCYGQPEQLFDFLEKLSFCRGPNAMKWFFHLKIPELNYSPKRHFLQDLSSAKTKRH